VIRLIHGTLALVALAALLLALPSSGVRAQVADSARLGPAARGTTAADTTQPARRLGPPISPKRALFQSLLIPGWGQASLERTPRGMVVAATVHW
jgi:hypothetical protein